ncbi:MAG: hypothetical protein P4N59_31330 [Negativicutes bacterium]|nr:hypothetical protein [Negativicutes bacterium]
MAGQLFSVTISVSRGFPEWQIVDWIDDSLIGVVEYWTYQTLAVAYYPNKEQIYGQIRIKHFYGASDRLVFDCLSAPPAGIRIIELYRSERVDNINGIPRKISIPANNIHIKW